MMPPGATTSDIDRDIESSHDDVDYYRARNALLVRDMGAEIDQLRTKYAALSAELSRILRHPDVRIPTSELALALAVLRENE